MAQYRKKPVEIEARQWVDDESGADILNWIEFAPPPATARIDPADGKIEIFTLEGPIKASKGDYIIKGVQGEFYPCKPDIFTATYEAVE